MTLKEEIRSAVRQFEGRIGDILIQSMEQTAEHDEQRIEIENIARVVITPFEVELYTFDDFIYFCRFIDGSIDRMRFQEGKMVPDPDWKWKKASMPVTQQHSAIKTEEVKENS